MTCSTQYMRSNAFDWQELMVNGSPSNRKEKGGQVSVGLDQLLFVTTGESIALNHQVDE